MKLTNETVAAAQQSVICFRFLCRVGEGGATNIVPSREASMRMRRLDRRTVNNKTEQQKREHASKRSMLLD